MPYDKPLDHEGVICPNSRTKAIKPPESVYDGRDAKGKVERRGIIAPHKHWLQGDDCEWSGLPVPVVPMPGAKEPGQLDAPPYPAWRPLFDSNEYRWERIPGLPLRVYTYAMGAKEPGQLVSLP